MATIYSGQPSLYDLIGFHQFDLKCVRNGYSIKSYIAITSDEDEDDEENSKYFVIKIGQFPSVADLHISKIKQYDKVLGKGKLKEITKAVGLAANGVGIGSFVYLRRVFEDLIEEAHQLAKNDNGWNEDLYQRNRMVEKIEQLKLHLPAFLVKNKNMYGILNIGIHSLNENDCLQYFDAIKVGIELILDEKVEKITKMKKIEDAQNRIQRINQIVAKK